MLLSVRLQTADRADFRPLNRFPLDWRGHDAEVVAKARANFGIFRESDRPSVRFRD
jgi:hypothetical protein